MLAPPTCGGEGLETYAQYGVLCKHNYVPKQWLHTPTQFNSCVACLTVLLQSKCQRLYSPLLQTALAQLQILAVIIKYIYILLSSFLRPVGNDMNTL